MPQIAVAVEMCTGEMKSLMIQAHGFQPAEVHLTSCSSTQLESADGKPLDPDELCQWGANLVRADQDGSLGYLELPPARTDFKQSAGLELWP
jgi:hypothetical protein